MRDVRTVVTEKTYHFVCPSANKEKDIVLITDLTDQSIASVETELGGECFYKQTKIEKAVYKMQLDKFVSSKDVEREVIE